MMEKLIKLPNIGPTLAQKLITVGVKTPQQLQTIGSEQALIKIASLENGGACINMLYALEGAIQNIRWHSLSQESKNDLKEIYHQVQKDINR